MLPSLHLYSVQYTHKKIFWRAETSTGERYAKQRAISLQLQHRITELRQAGNLHSLTRPPNFCSQAQLSTCDATMVTGRGDRDPQPLSRRIASACQPGGFRGTRHSAGRQRPGNTGIKGLDEVQSSSRRLQGRARLPPGSAGLSRPGPRPSPQSSGGGGGAFPAAAPGSSASPRVPPPFQVYPRHLPPSSHSSPGAAGRTPSPSLPAPPGVCGQGRWARS